MYTRFGGLRRQLIVSADFGHGSFSVAAEYHAAASQMQSPGDPLVLEMKVTTCSWPTDVAGGGSAGVSQ